MCVIHRDVPSQRIPDSKTRRTFPCGGFVIRLRMLRLDRQLTQRQLAKRAGLLQSDLSRIETGRANATTAELKRLARVLECAPEALMENVVAQ